MAPPPCGNPLFLSWLTEIYETLRAADARSTQTYKNACDSLRACPVTYTRPAELVHLRGIGPTIVKQLERKQKEYYRELGEEVPEGPAVQVAPKASGAGNKRKAPAAPRGRVPREEREWSTDSEDSDALPASAAAAGPSQKRKAPAGPRGRVPREEREWSTDPEDSDAALARAAPVAKKSKTTANGTATGTAAKSKAKKLYVPRARSGAYALLLALLLRLPVEAHVAPPPDDEDTTDLRDGWASKAELTDEAQEWCDVSMTQGEKGGYHNGWSAMAGLTQKGLVYRESNPARFRLTELGLETARAIYKLVRPMTSNSAIPAGQPKPRKEKQVPAPAAFPMKFSPPPQRMASAREVTVLGDLDSDDEAPAGPNRGIAVDFGFYYLNVSNVRVDTRDRAASRMDPATCTMRRKIEFSQRLMAHAAVQKLSGVERLEDKPSWCHGWIAEQDAPQQAPGDAADATAPALTHKHPRFSSHMPARTVDVDYGRGDTEASDVDLEAAPADAEDFELESGVPFPAGSYEVILVMDTREIRKRRDVDAMTRGLLDKGVKVELRALQIGDVAWIARDTTGTRKGEDAECVLDFVVERKRLDDLVQSIKDGRYEDQKLRLTNSCIRNGYYIIEDWDAQRNKAESGQAIATSKSQTQIVDGFFLRDTYSLKETIAFLKTMHDTINELYEYETLYLIPSKYISRPKYASLQKRLRERYPTKYFGTSFETYQAINSKSANNTLLETFARMLMCVRGMSSEKVALLLDVWQTPRAMWDDLQKRQEEIVAELAEERAQGTAVRGKSKVRPIEVFFADAVEGRTARQKIGDALSRELYAVLTQE